MSQRLAPQLPRQSAATDNLQRLREIAYSRLLAEEESLATKPTKVSRRWALQNLALAGMAAGISVKAHATPGPRSTAPQYGAPGLYGNPRAPTSMSFATRDDLKTITAWTKSHTLLVTPERGTRDGYIWGYSTPSRTLYYMPGSGDPIGMLLLSDEASGSTYLVPAGQTFYVTANNDILGCRWGEGELIVTPSFFKTATNDGGDSGAIERFAAAMDDAALIRAAAPSRAAHISLTKGVGVEDRQRADKILANRSIYTAKIAENILTIACETGSFVIDLKAKKLVRFESEHPN